MDKKITCSTCANEDRKICTVKKIGVAINKRRRCDKFIFEPLKVKPKQLVKTVRVSWEEKEKLRQEYKEALKEARRLEREGRLGRTTTNPKHPLTGDLSRFVSTVDD